MSNFRLFSFGTDKADKVVQISNNQMELIITALADYKNNLQYEDRFNTMNDLARAENEVEDLFATLYEIVRV